MIEINENYNDETTLDEYYPIVKENIRVLAAAEKSLEAGVADGSAIDNGAIKANHVADGAVALDKLDSKVIEAIVSAGMQPLDQPHVYSAFSGSAINTATKTMTVTNNGEYIRAVGDIITVTFGAGFGAVEDSSGAMFMLDGDPITLDGLNALTASSSALTLAPGACTTFVYIGSVAGPPDERGISEIYTNAWMVVGYNSSGGYSTAPQQIGTWLDGMPVWRAAFKAPITDTMKTDKACSIFYDLSFVKSAESVKLVIGGFACIDNGSVVDNNTTTLDGFGRFNWDSINPNAEYISGYIDFVTEAENIKS